MADCIIPPGHWTTPAEGCGLPSAVPHPGPAGQWDLIPALFPADYWWRAGHLMATCEPDTPSLRVALEDLVVFLGLSWTQATAILTGRALPLHSSPCGTCPDILGVCDE